MRTRKTTTIDKDFTPETKFKSNLLKTGYVLRETNNTHTLESFFTSFDELADNFLPFDLECFKGLDLKYLQLECNDLKFDIEKV